MKKYGIGWIILDVLLLLDALLGIWAGDPDPGDYFTLVIAGLLIAIFIVMKICEEIQIQKRLKQMREERTREKASN